MVKEVVLEVGSEGGSLTILREQITGKDWQFRVLRNEAALYDLLSEEDRKGMEFHEKSKYICFEFRFAYRREERF